MHTKLISAALFASIALVTLAPQALAVDVADVGFVDQAAIGSLPAFVAAQQQFGQFRDQLSRDFQGAIRGKPQAEQQRIYADFNQRMAAKQHELFDPLLSRAQTAIALVAATKSMSVVVDKQIIIYGGHDITKDVIDTINQPGQVVPPVNTPPPSEIGFVDQQQIDALPKAKAANDEFMASRQRLGQDMNKQLAATKDRQAQAAIVQAFNEQLKAEQKRIAKPIADATDKAIADVARKRKLILVVDQTDRVYGGTDITADVVAALK